MHSQYIANVEGFMIFFHSRRKMKMAFLNTVVPYTETLLCTFVNKFNHLTSAFGNTSFRATNKKPNLYSMPI